MKTIFRSILAAYLIVMLILLIRFFSHSGSPLYFWLSVFLTAFAVLTLFGIKDGIQKILQTRYIQKNGVTVNAVITGYHTVTYRLKTHYPIIRFKDRNKHTHRFQSTAGMTFIPSRYKKGKTVKTAYLPEQPEHFVLIPAYYLHAVLETVMFSAFALPSMLGSLILLWKI